MYNIIVKQEQQIIFYDFNECLLTTWLRDSLYALSFKKIFVFSCDYYKNKIEFEKFRKTENPKCIIIQENKKKSIDEQINFFSEIGFKNIIVCQNNENNKMYNINNFRKYLLDNRDILQDCIKNENNYICENWELEIQHDDNIFYKQKLFLTNFLKWCCVK
mgnify:CR=1 FL=1